MVNYFSKYKFIFYLANIVLIVEYLFPGSLMGCFLGSCKVQPQLTSEKLALGNFFILSTNHIFGFFIFSLLGLITYKKYNNINVLFYYLVFLSVFLEILHYFIPKRSFEFSDLFGNLAGVIIVFIICFFLKKNENN
jgi:VanZ family protein